MLTGKLPRVVVSTLVYSLVSLLMFAPTILAQEADNRQILTAEQQQEQAAQLAAEGTFAQIAVIGTAIPNANVNIRSGPSMDYTVQRVVPSGTQITVVGQDATSAWLRVRLADGSEGWLARYLTNFAGTAPTFDAPPLAPPAQPETEVATIVTAAPNVNVNVRSGPSMNYGVQRTTTPGMQITVLGQDPTNTWLRVRLPDGFEGWVARFLTNYVGTAPTVEAPPLAPPPQAPPAADPQPGTATIVTAIPNVNVNVRSGPSMNYGVQRTMIPGTQVTILGQDPTNTWLRVRLPDGFEGWVARFLTNFVGAAPIVEAPPLAPPPQAPPAADPQTGVASIVTAAPTINVNVRSGPSTNYSVLRTVTPGTQVNIIGQDPTNTWLRVRLPDATEGWVARFLTNFVGTAPTISAPPVMQPPLAPPPQAPPATIPPTVTPAVTTLPGQSDPLLAPPVEQWLSQNWRTLQEGQVHWYRFFHHGDELAVQVWMDAEPNEFAGFRVFDEQSAQAIMAGQNPDNFQPIGAGTPNEAEPGWLFWRGTFGEAGRYYVMVDHGGTGSVPYTIVGSGPGFGQ